MIDPVSLEKARLYEQYRLPYAADLADDLLRNTGPVQTVADIGAGTGQLARLFAGRTPTIYAVEPDPAMRAIAADALHELPAITIIDACAEYTTLPDHSCDLIVIGNAYHRFQIKAVAELRRILAPGGKVAIISYWFTQQAFGEMLFSRLATLESMVARQEKSWHRLPLAALFGDQELDTFRYPQSYEEDWAVFWGSARSGIEAPAPGEADFARFEQINREVFETFAVNGRLRIDYETRVTIGKPARL